MQFLMQPEKENIKNHKKRKEIVKNKNIKNVYF